MCECVCELSITMFMLCVCVSARVCERGERECVRTLKESARDRGLCVRRERYRRLAKYKRERPTVLHIVEPKKHTTTRVMHGKGP